MVPRLATTEKLEDIPEDTTIYFMAKWWPSHYYFWRTWVKCLTFINYRSMNASFWRSCLHVITWRMRNILHNNRRDVSKNFFAKTFHSNHHAGVSWNVLLTGIMFSANSPLVFLHEAFGNRFSFGGNLLLMCPCCSVGCCGYRDLGRVQCFRSFYQ